MYKTVIPLGPFKLSCTFSPRDSSRPPLSRISKANNPAKFDSIGRKALSREREPKAGVPDQIRLRNAQARNAQTKRLINKLVNERDRHLPYYSEELEMQIEEIEVARQHVVAWRLFPINNLPDEITMTIFQYVVCAPPDGVLNRLRITWVCRRWRYIAIRDVFLWNTILFSDRPPYNRSLAFVERAGLAPLNIMIDETDEQWRKDRAGNGNAASEDDHPYTAAMAGALMDGLLPKIHRIRSLAIVVDTWLPALMILAKLRDAGAPLARLEHFELHRAGHTLSSPSELDAHTMHIPLCGGRDLPKLDFMCLDGVPIDWSVHRIVNLSVLDLRRLSPENCPTPHQFHDILKASPNLRKLGFTAAGPRWLQKDLVDASLPPIDLLNLTTLVLGKNKQEYSLYCLQTFNAPHLIELTIHTVAKGDCGPLVEGLTSRFPEVQILTVATMEIDDSVLNKRRLIAWLKSMPDIRFLKLGQVEQHFIQAFLEDPRQCDGSIVDILSPQTGMVPLCSKLIAFEFQHLPFEMVKNFVEGRKNLKVPLRSVYVLYPWSDSMSKEENDLLKSMAKLYHLPQKTLTPEEMEIRKSCCQSRGISVGNWH